MKFKDMFNRRRLARILGATLIIGAIVLISLYTAGLAIPLAAPFIYAITASAAVAGGGIFLLSAIFHKRSQPSVAKVESTESVERDELIKQQGKAPSSSMLTRLFHRGHKAERTIHPVPVFQGEVVETHSSAPIESHQPGVPNVYPRLEEHLEAAGVEPKLTSFESHEVASQTHEKRRIS